MSFRDQVREIARISTSMVTHLRVRPTVGVGAPAKTRACGAMSGARVDDPGAVTCEACRPAAEAKARQMEMRR